ncbi:MAG TPA: dinitrogenase iron-molybdenum cofactor biosynthesis protein, partial [Ruminococcaceae bacterium]|nr:dinitrogenase iron-molybdenum cofactor biosynthesis protein [Oscillospiraceae bacterium]
MSGCNHDCSSCASKCSEEKRDMRLAQNEYSNVKKVIGVVSGKGGVGKSTVTSLLAVAAQTKGYQTAILDADVTGPSIPKAFGIHERAEGTEQGLFPVDSKLGIRIMSVNLLLEKEDAPVVWRGPVISGVINQFWQEVMWGDVDCMFVDMPPG